jgi:LysM repeat protein
MKILKVFGIVLAVHAAAFMFVFAIPGCRSTTRRASTSAEPKPTDTQPAVVYPGLTGYKEAAPHNAGASQPAINNELNPAIAPAPAEDFSAVVAASDSPVSAPAVRFNPTRPENPAASALQNPSVTDVQRVTTYTVAPRDSLWTVARKHGITVGELETANNLRPGAVLQVGKKLIIPEKTPAPGTTEAGGVGGDTLTYTVRDGDTLGAIARRSGTTVGAIKTLNKLRGDALRTGQRLVLPASSDTAAAVAANAAATPSRPKAEGAKHLVRPGETLSQIARAYGVSQAQIGAANHIANPASIRVGQELIIPGATAPVSVPVTQPVAPETVPAISPVPSEPAPSAPASPVAPSLESGPVSAPAAEQPPVVPIEGSSPIAPAP